MKRLTPETTIWIYRLVFISIVLLETALIYVTFQWTPLPQLLKLMVPLLYFVLAVRPAFSDIKLAAIIESRNPELGEDLLSYIELKKSGLDYGKEFVELLRKRASRELSWSTVLKAVRPEPWGIRLSYMAVIWALLRLLMFRPAPVTAIFPREIMTFEDSLVVVHTFGCQRCQLMVDSTLLKPSFSSETESRFVVKLKHSGTYIGRLIYRGHPIDSLKVIVYKRPVIREVRATIYRYGHRVTLENPTYVPIRQGVKVDFLVTAANADSFKAKFDGRDVAFSGDTVMEFALRPDSAGMLSFTLFKANLTAKSSRNIAIDIVKDEPPFVQLLFPPSGTDLPDSQKITLAGYAEDDFGLRSISGHYVFGGDTVTAVRQLSHGRNADTLISTIDLSHLGLLPGDAVQLFICATDIADHRVCSTPVTVRFPTMEEIYKRTSTQFSDARNSMNQLSTSVDSMLREFRKLEEQIKSNRSLSWNEREKLQQMIKESQQKLKQLQERMKKLREAIDKINSLTLDPELARKTDEISQMLQQLMPEELLKQLQKLQEATQDEDVHQLTRMLEDLQKNQKEYLKKLEAVENLLKRALEESKLKEFIEKAHKLAEEQQQLKNQTSIATPEDADTLLNEQKRLEDAAKELRREMQQLAADATDSSITEELNRLSDMHLSKALSEMQKAEGALQQGKLGKASQSQSKAAQSLQQLADELQKFRDELVNRRKQEVIRKLGILVSEGLTLSQEQAEIVQSNSNTFELADRQAAVQRGIASFSGEVYQVASEGMFLKPDDIALFGSAANYAATAAQLYGLGNNAGGRIYSRKALKFLYAGIRSLLEAQQMAQQAQSSSNMDQLMQQLSEAMKQQQQIAAGTQALLPLPTPMPSSLQQMLQELARQQMQLAQQLQELSQKIGNQMVSNQVGKAAQDAEKIAKDMQRGRVNEDIVRRQKEVAQKLLDAQRAMKEREFTFQRESKPGKFVLPGRKTAAIHDLQEIERVKNSMLKSKSYPRGYKKLIEAYYKTLLSE